MFFKKAKRYMLWRIIEILGIEFLFISICSTIHVVFNHSAQLHEFGKRCFIKEWKGLYLEIVLLSIKNCVNCLNVSQQEITTLGLRCLVTLQ